MVIIWKRSHYGWWSAYTEDGAKLKVPSVSAVVSSKDDPELDKWIEEVGQEEAERIMKRAADRGTVMHKYLENYFAAYGLKGDARKALLYAQKKTLIDLQKAGIDKKQFETGRSLFYQMLNVLNPEKFEPEINRVLSLETKICNFLVPYRGAYDINYVKRTDGKEFNVIADYKTASSYVEKNSVKERKYKLQLAGYWKAYELMKGRELDYAKLFISVKNNNDVQEIYIDKSEFSDLWAEFKELCEHWHKQNNQSLEMFRNYRIEK